jgi:arylsulfatase A-like enzyme
MLKSVDESLGRVMDRFDELGLTANTLFIFYSDNGGNTHSNVPGSRGMDAKQGHPKWDFVQDWKNGPETSRRQTTRRCVKEKEEFTKAGNVFL